MDFIISAKKNKIAIFVLHYFVLHFALDFIIEHKNTKERKPGTKVYHKLKHFS